MRETRKEARALAEFTRGQYPSGHLLHRTAASVRVVRAWIPLK